MTETAKTTCTIGKYEAEGIRLMKDIAPAGREPPKSYIASPEPENPHGYRTRVWHDGAKAWSDPGEMRFSRASAILDLARHIEHSDVTLTDEIVYFDGLTREGLDDSLTEGRTMMCPEGAPGSPDTWVGISLDWDGRGGPIHAAGRFPKVSLAGRFMRDAPKPADAMHKAAILVRHGRVARSVVDQARWGVIGRPDILGRQQDEALARAAQDKIDMDRAWKEDGVPASRFQDYRARRQALGTW